ncbi:hypothetical protein DSC_11450 [Pseudoxanthomonas spadix BD-a59]|uniref:Uncharacterized protein n=1 Tax=Pseudoxanthomonas spadix (strain BD-a59) TaxID=1045855 RepID=G7UQ50_PSEUP|nr:hypothetical protein [Pseudoxanthomonas spadix]AER56934.1 hypothetical protein DSC_11450 [Pseudoxanthomonas spadix BD-a59]
MSKVTFHVSDEKHAQVAGSQKEFLEGLAKRIESGEALTSRMEQTFAAGAIRAFAASIPMGPKRKQGPAPKFCHGSEALVYAVGRANGLTHGQALERIADRVGVSEQAVEKAIKKYRPGAFDMVGIPDPGNQ